MIQPSELKAHRKGNVEVERGMVKKNNVEHATMKNFSDIIKQLKLHDIHMTGRDK